MPRLISVQCACVSMNPGTIVFPLTSNTLAPDGTLPFAPTLLMRLFSTTMSAFLMTSSSLPVFIVTTVAPRSTIVPLGVLRGNSRLTAISWTSFCCSFSFFSSFFSSFLSSFFSSLAASADFFSSADFLSATADFFSSSFFSPSFFSSFGGSNEIALSGSRNRLEPTAHVIVLPASAHAK